MNTIGEIHREYYFILSPVHMKILRIGRFTGLASREVCSWRYISTGSEYKVQPLKKILLNITALMIDDLDRRSTTLVVEVYARE